MTTRRVWHLSGLALAISPAITGGALAEPVTAAVTSPSINGIECAAMRDLDLGELPDAPTKITSAKLIAASGTLPAYCEVRGYVAPQVRWAVRMPAQGWNQRMMFQGCGGFCGDVFIERADDALRRSYATAFTDMGHSGTALDGRWAYNNRQAEIDFGYRATHVATIAAKAAIDAFYGHPRKFSYFRGCSTGGRQALVEAQRYPTDYDGIIAGAPVITYARGSALQLMWSMLANRNGAGDTWLKPNDVGLLRQSALKACDANDGLADGIIDDPRQCRFDPATLICKPGERPAGQCLSSGQTAAAAKIYAGPSASDGRALYYGVEPGSEDNWLINYVGAEGRPPLYYSFIEDLFRYMAFSDDPGPTWHAGMLDFDRDPARLGTMDALYDGTNPDLRRLKAAKVKIIGYHGWADQSVVPMTSVDYYETVARTMGGLPQTQDFYRLFMVPGMNHCFGGVGANSFDFLGAMEQWVERGEAPDRLVGQSLHDGRSTRSRAVYPYPDQGRYAGKGNPDDASSFVRKPGRLGLLPVLMTAR